MSAVPAGAAPGVYKPRRPQASPLFRLVSDHFRAFHAVYEERFAATYGDWRPVVREVADKFLACGVLAHGFARIRCDTCTHECLLAFSCKARYFCPSCHAKRLALWTLWLEGSLLAPGVPHRQVVLTIPKRLRAWCLYRRSLLGDLARVAARTVTAAVRALTGEPTLAVGIVGCIQTHGSRANWHPHIHMLATDGGFRADGTFVSWPAHDTAALTEAFRRAVLRLFVRRGLFEREDAEAMLAWPHSGFHVHDAVLVSATAVAIQFPIPKIDSTAGKDAIVARVKSAFAFCNSALKPLTDAGLAEQVPFFGGRTASRAAVEMDLAADLADHYAAIANYMRLNGITPPSARGRGMG